MTKLIVLIALMAPLPLFGEDQLLQHLSRDGFEPYAFLREHGNELDLIERISRLLVDDRMCHEYPVAVGNGVVILGKLRAIVSAPLIIERINVPLTPTTSAQPPPQRFALRQMGMDVIPLILTELGKSPKDEIAVNFYCLICIDILAMHPSFKDWRKSEKIRFVYDFTELFRGKMNIDMKAQLDKNGFVKLLKKRWIEAEDEEK